MASIAGLSTVTIIIIIIFKQYKKVIEKKKIKIKAIKSLNF